MFRTLEAEFFCGRVEDGAHFFFVSVKVFHHSELEFGRRIIVVGLVGDFSPPPQPVKSKVAAQMVARNFFM